MAKKKKAALVKRAVKRSDPERDLEMALDGLERAVNDLNLHIKTLRKAFGHPFISWAGVDKHPFCK
jgi:hypothetical protein